MYPTSARSLSVGSGPLLHERRRGCYCTDLPCCLVFVLALVAYVALAGFGFTHGNTDLLQNLAGGVDYQGRRCGHSAGVEKFKKTYFTLANGTVAPVNWTASSRGELKPVCTTQCPEAAGAVSSRAAYMRQPDLCPVEAYEAGLCTWYGGKTIKVTGYCIDPAVFETAAPSQQVLQDLQATRWFFLLAFFVAVLTGFCFLGLVRRCGHVIVITLVLLLAAVPLLVGCLMYFHPQTLEQLGDESLSAEKQKKISYWLWGASAVILFLACLFCSTIRNVVAVIRATSTFLQDVPSQLFQPLIFAVVQITVFAIWVSVLLGVSTVGAKEGNHSECLRAGQLFCVDWNTNNQRYAIVFLIFMLYWIVSFFHALSHYGTAHAVKAWYFTRADPMTGRKIPDGSGGCCGCALTVRGLSDGLVHHVGSLAFGGFLVALAKVVWLLLCWARHTDPQAATNPVVACIYRASLCVAKCVERFVEFVSEHAYVEMALTGRGFVYSAQKALAKAIMKPGLFAVSGSVSTVIQLLGLILVATSTVMATFFTLQLFPPQGLASLDAPLVVSGLIGLCVAEVMMHPFSTAARASLHCVIDDEEAASQEGRTGTVHAPQHMQRFLDDYNGEPQRRRCCG